MIYLIYPLFKYKEDLLDLDEFIRCYKVQRESDEYAKRINFNFIKEVSKIIHNTYDFNDIKQFYNSMSLTNKF